ncbi:MAG: hypothetical protein RLZZ546_667 [Bacteroidota bacterium]
MSNVQKYSYFGIILIALLLGLYLGRSFFSTKNYAEEKSSVVVEKIEKVFKLITVETNVSELYQYKDYYNYDWSFLRKKAILRVNAKISVGYDIKKLNIRVDQKTKKIYISKLPKVEVLSVDHNLDYYDVEEGVFNSFSPEDYNHINKNAKEYITKIASNKEVLQKAEEQEQNLMSMLTTMSRGMGYELTIEEENNIKN